MIRRSDRGRAAKAITAIALFLAGCEKAPKPPATSPSPTTALAPSMEGTLTIDGREVRFPPATITLIPQANGLDVVLNSESNSAAAMPQNTFTFEMKLDAEKATDLAAIPWTHKAPPDEPQDSTNGIFLAEGHRQLQPTDVTVRFQNVGSRILAHISGEFFSFDPDDSTVPSNTVDVDGTIDASLQEQN